MNKSLTLIAALLLGSAASSYAQVYVNADSLPLYGKAREDTKERYERLPAEFEGRSRDAVWYLGRNSAGLYIRFNTDSKNIWCRWTAKFGNMMNHQTLVGTRGLDLYGLNDNYDTKNAHVLPMLVRRFHEAKEAGLKEVTVWGTGTPLREFMYAGDLAKAVVYLMENKSAKEIGEFINIGTGTEVTILELAQMIKKIVGFEGELVFDKSKPDGTMRKLMDVSRINNLGWKAETSLEEGIKIVYNDFLTGGNIRK